nr:MAG TPA: hypothetical protein [Caudoviricetes sp.]
MTPRRSPRPRSRSTCETKSPLHHHGAAGSSASWGVSPGPGAQWRGRRCGPRGSGGGWGPSRRAWAGGGPCLGRRGPC